MSATDVEKSARLNTSDLGTGQLVALDGVIENNEEIQDAEVLNALGYKQEFKRELTFTSTFGVAFSIIGILPSIATTLSYVGYSGSSGLLWSWIFASILIQFIALSLAEICSAMPTSGGMYYAAAKLAPPGWGPICAWITGWSNFIGMATFTPSVDWGLASQILAAVAMKRPDFEPQSWQTFLLFLALLASHAGVASLPTHYVAILNKISPAYNCVILIIFYIMVPAGSINHPKTNGTEVWTNFENGTEWPNGVAFMMTCLITIWSMCGIDAGFHLTEECSNAEIAAPRAICMSAQSGGIFGFFVILVIAYCAKDYSVIASSPIGQPMGSFLLQVLGENGGVAMFALIIVAQWLVGQGCLIAASRVTYAYSRDGAIIGAKYWSRINKTTYTPVNAVLFLTAIGVALGLLGFNAYAISAVFSVGALAQYVAFVICIFLRVFYMRGNFQRGKWHLGRFSYFSGIMACVWIVMIIPFMCFPGYRGKDVTSLNMNWTCLVYGGPMGFALVWYAVSARKWFKGPRLNI